MIDPTTDVLFDGAVWQPALDKYAAVTQLTVTVYDAEARIVCGPLHPTPLYALFEEYGYDSGIFADCARQCLVQTAEHPAVVGSAYGLAAIGASLQLEERIVGVAVAGYVLTEFAQSLAIDRLARHSGIPFRRLWELARRQQPAPPRRLIMNGELLQVLGDTLLRENYRTRLYEATAVQLEAVAAAKDDFLSMLSHELRTPMTSILGWTQLLEHTSYDPELIPAAIQNIERSGRAQARIIEDMLDLSHMLVGQLSINLVPVDVMEIVVSSIAGAEPMAGERGIRIEATGDSASVLADAQRMRQVLANLLSNSLKFSHPNSRIRVSVEAGKVQVSISVIDAGRGIKPEFLPHIFRRFSQQQKGEYGGFGLGLAIAQHIVERHGGSIEAESGGEGQGATFRVILPNLETPESVPVRSRRGVSRGRIVIVPKHVLVVDDDDSIRALVGTLLRREGFEVDDVESGNAAIHFINQKTYDAVILDLMMRDGTGHDVLQTVAARHPNVKCVVVISAASPATIEAMDPANIEAKLRKPFDIHELLAAVRHCTA